MKALRRGKGEEELSRRMGLSLLFLSLP